MSDLPPLPKTVKTLYSVYPVTVERLADQHLGSHNRPDHTDGPKIQIDNRVGLPAQWHTFFHEWIHALEWECGIRGLKERQVDDLAKAMFASILRNGWKLPGE